MSMQNTTLQPYFLHGNEGQATWFLACRMTLKASNESTGGALTVMEMLQAPGGTSPWHVHHREDEMFYLLEGNILFKCGDELFEGGPGSFVFLPRDIPHSHKIIGETTARWLNLTTPGGGEGFFIEAGTPALEDGLRPQPGNHQQLAASAAKYGLEILGPPPL